MRVTLDAILAANSQITDPDRIDVGARLAIPGLQDSSESLYVVQAGDTLTSLAASWGCSVADIVAANSIANPDANGVGESPRRPG